MNDFQRLLRRIKHGMVSICLCACLKIHRRDKERKDGITDNVVVERGIEENDNNEEMVDEILVIPSPKSNQYRLERMRKVGVLCCTSTKLMVDVCSMTTDNNVLVYLFSEGSELGELTFSR
jgi:hypothetical protein